MQDQANVLSGSCILLALMFEVFSSMQVFRISSFQDNKMQTHSHIMCVDDALRGISIATRRTGLPVERAKRCLEENTR
jgi:hypothetical protein